MEHGRWYQLSFRHHAVDEMRGVVAQIRELLPKERCSWQTIPNGRDRLTRRQSRAMVSHAREVSAQIADRQDRLFSLIDIFKVFR